ncbi:hypothetical protein SAMN02745163_03742 [Clostridium cavendishii DSM 21758]|uniref:Uncharacterized protein n=1 Tax=Clostridium cavendishii DSM 21758 TaxID=1121302 RepID=A0A1M6S3I6_9CLOT|nr:hypothetical protein [Clostridium cavendishii]SHK39236.1 hypothetical protein SAMN02745163_03742 [Clostridium cavendishii DSM 21758]
MGKDEFLIHDDRQDNYPEEKEFTETDEKKLDEMRKKIKDRKNKK